MRGHEHKSVRLKSVVRLKADPTNSGPYQQRALPTSDDQHQPKIRRERSSAYFPGSAGGSILQGDGFHFAPSFSSLKCVLVMNGSCRYFGSSTTVRTRRMTSPFGSGPTLSTYSVIFASALYGTPFLRRYPSRKFVVVTNSEPPTGAGPRPRPRPPLGNCGTPLRSKSSVCPATCHSACE